MKNKVITPNYEILKQSCIFSMNDAWNEYRKINSQLYNNTWYDSEGNFCGLGDIDKKLKEDSQRMQELLVRIVKLKEDLKEINYHLSKGE